MSFFKEMEPITTSRTEFWVQIDFCFFFGVGGVCQNFFFNLAQALLWLSGHPSLLPDLHFNIIINFKSNYCNKITLKHTFYYFVLLSKNLKSNLLLLLLIWLFFHYYYYIIIVVVIVKKINDHSDYLPVLCHINNTCYFLRM